MVPRRLWLWLSFGFACAIALFAGLPAQAELWYDVNLGSLPEAQGWLYFTLPTVTATLSDGAAVFDTTSASGIRGGWTRIADPALVRSNGVELRFTVEVVAETHTSTNRAGFSVILLDEDRRGIELGFWTDRVWAQSDVPLFIHSEEVLFPTTGQAVSYLLTLSADSYELSVDRATPDNQHLLGGPVRDYTAFSGFPNVYATPNFVFLGDDTTSGAARIRLQRVELTRLLPAPPSLGVVRGADTVQLRWSAAAGIDRWVLESTADPVAGPWATDLSARTLETEPGGGAGVVVTGVAPAGTQRFYRLH